MEDNQEEVELEEVSELDELSDSQDESDNDEDEISDNEEIAEQNDSKSMSNIEFMNYCKSKLNIEGLDYDSIKFIIRNDSDFDDLMFYVNTINNIADSSDEDDKNLGNNICNILLSNTTKKNVISKLLDNDKIARIVYLISIYNNYMKKWTKDKLTKPAYTLEEILSDKTIYVVNNHSDISQEIKDKFNMTIDPKYTHVILNEEKPEFTLEHFHAQLDKHRLNEFDFTNIIIAGGCFHRNSYINYKNDIDMFIIGGEENKKAAIMAFINHFTNNDDGNDVGAFVINSTTLNCNHRGRNFQLVLRVYDNVQQVLDTFDIGAACMYYDGTGIYANAECMYSILSGNIIINKNRIRTNYTNRLTKYIRNKNFNILFVDDISNQMYTITTIKDLCKIISLKPFMILYDKHSSILSFSPICTVNALYEFVNYNYKLSMEEFLNSLNFANRIGKVDFLSKITPNFSSADGYYSAQHEINTSVELTNRLTINFKTVSTVMTTERLIVFIESGKKKIRIMPENDEKLSNVIDLYIAFEHYRSDFYIKKNPLMGLNSLF
jgi:hypothetical protein